MKKAQQSGKTANETNIVKPPALKAGDRVGLVCPGSRPASPAVLEKCIRVVEEIGLKAVPGKAVMGRHAYMAGSDAERLDDLTRFFADDSISGIFCITGGFGSIRILADLDYKSIARNPKIIVGCDDNTNLLLALNKRSKLVTMHGPNLDQISSRYSFDRMKEAVTGKVNLKPVSASELGEDVVGGGRPYSPVVGITSGALLGGNLSAIVSLMGTPFQPDLTETVLFLEDKNERIDILERWFTTLYLSGELSKTTGVAFGKFENCDGKGSYDLLSLEEILGDRLKRMGKPSCFCLPLGQGSRSATVPLGIAVQLDATRGILEFSAPHLS